MPTMQVERLIRDAGGTPHAVWLDFQERFGGYIEVVGPDDFAIWGLARAADAKLPPTWSEPNRVHISPGYDGFPEAIACADANPVHQYELRADGWFAGIGGPCPSFDMKVERHGVMHEFYSRGVVHETLVTRQSDAPEHQRLLQDMAQWLVVEASSDGAQFFLAPRRLLRFYPRVRQMILLEIASPAA
ncbi:hypothetical protein [Sandaracinus amylolyticus]|uniref:hypothetical protein n=1 Tax=Sandaracinus amylolyticus TaxID=927083 RepID=UPI001F3236BC|nr:hypothetical protein [Sandaracinus amylolyticus]